MASKKSKAKKGSWIVRMRCEVIKEYVFDDCTEEEANEPAWDKVADETEVDQVDWEVLDVKPNE